MNIQENFKIEFNNAFQRLILTTERVRDLQGDLEWTSDILAGPLYHILKHGNCNYIFEDRRLPGVTTVEDFRAWANQVAEDYRKEVEDFDASNSAEAEDRALLLEQANAIQRAAELAYQIQREQGKK